MPKKSQNRQIPRGRTFVTESSFFPGASSFFTRTIPRFQIFSRSQGEAVLHDVNVDDSFGSRGNHGARERKSANQVKISGRWTLPSCAMQALAAISAKWVSLWGGVAIRWNLAAASSNRFNALSGSCCSITSIPSAYSRSHSRTRSSLSRR